MNVRTILLKSKKEELYYNMRMNNINIFDYSQSQDQSCRYNSVRKHM